MPARSRMPPGIRRDRRGDPERAGDVAGELSIDPARRYPRHRGSAPAPPSSSGKRARSLELVIAVRAATAAAPLVVVEPAAVEAGSVVESSAVEPASPAAAA